MDEDTTYLRARDLAGQTGLSEGDIRRSLRTFGEFFTSRKEGRARVYAPESGELLKQIAELEAMGTTVATIRGILRGGVAGKDGEDPGLAVAEATALAAGENLTLGVLSDVKALQEELADLNGMVSSLKDRVAEHEQKIIGHQQQLRLLRHEMDEQKTDALARKMEGRNTSFWRRLFS